MHDWRSIAMSSDGSKLVAAAYNSYLYVSRDSGVTWAEQTAAGLRNWRAVASSADGARLAAEPWGGPIHIGAVEGPTTATYSLSALPANANAALKNAVKNAIIGATSETCYAFDQPSIATLSANGVTAPDSKVTILGGVKYNLSCTINGGSATVEIALGALYKDVSQLRIYKGSGALLQDVTHKVSLINKDVNGTLRTVLSYIATDGDGFDEDDIVNGTIADPIYIGALGEPDESGSLASTGSSANNVAGLAVALLAGGFVLWRKNHKTRGYLIGR